MSDRLMRARFSGSPADLLPTAPAIGDTVTFVVTARCSKHIEEEMADGEHRLIAAFVTSSIKKVDGQDPVAADGPGDEPLPGFEGDPDDEGDF